MTTLKSFGERVRVWAADSWERIAKTGLQVFAAYITVVMQAGGAAFDWAAGLSQTALAMLLAGLTSVISFPSLGDALWCQYVERAVKTFVQVLISGIGTAALFSEVDWATVVQMSWMAAVYSVATSLATSKIGIPGQVNISAPVKVRRELLDDGPVERSGAGGF